MQNGNHNAKRLSSDNWNHIYSSTLERAKQTALIIGNSIGVDIHLDDRLRERAGLIEGTTEEERIEKWGTDWRDLNLGLEPIEAVQKRGEEFLEEIVLNHQGEKVLVVSHGALIEFDFINLLPDFPTKHFGNTSITIVKKIGNQWTCELHNCTKHLEGNNEEG